MRRIKEEIITNYQTDMGSIMSSIAIYNDIMKHQLKEISPESLHLVEKIKDNTRLMISLLEEMKWTLESNRTNGYENLSLKMRDYGSRLLNETHIQFNVEISDEVKKCELSLIQKRYVYLIFKELVNNAFRHAECAQIQVTIDKMDNGQICLLIRDDGRGFDANMPTDGNGLLILRESVKKMKGFVRMVTELGTGTSIQVIF